MTILYTSRNLNLATVRLVAKAVKEQISINQYPLLKRVVLFNSPGVTSEQINVYRSIFGSVPVDDIPIQSEGIVDSQVFTDAFKLQGEKFIDLTNGQKTTSAQLYLAASLLGIDKAPGTMVKTEEQVNTIRFQKMNIFGFWEEVSE
jgi:hypothetical protein